MDVVLRAMQDRGGENYVKKEVRMATKDFIAPYGILINHYIASRKVLFSLWEKGIFYTFATH
ncbi:MAG: hypothetical protein V8T88_04530 [Phocaeicola sp.]|uniref:hypothetical protein n=1 Tax=Phocaeicola sp. TaxID=2773926 RepID=UPI00300F3647